MKIHVICLNDGVEYAIIENNNKAKKKMKQLKEAHYKKNKYIFNNEEDYNQRCYWHLHTIDGE